MTPTPMFAAAVFKSTGWELLKDVNGGILQSSNAADLVAQVSPLFPANRIQLFELLTITQIAPEPFTYTGGSSSPNVQLQKDLTTVTQVPGV